MSANEHTETVFECIRRGAEDYLLKPVTKKEVQYICQHVWRRQKHGALNVQLLGADEVGCQRHSYLPIRLRCSQPHCTGPCCRLRTRCSWSLSQAASNLHQCPADPGRAGTTAGSDGELRTKNARGRPPRQLHKKQLLHCCQIACAQGPMPAVVAGSRQPMARQPMG